MDKTAQYENLLKEKLSEFRYVHSLEVAKSSEYLSKKYGGDSEKMFIAGLLHDILKEADKDETFYYVNKYNIEMTDIEKTQKKLWHAVVGAYYIKYELGIDDEEIFNAVRYHTTGRKNMSLNEKILFIADFISADRNYNGVVEMRNRAERSLESAMDMGLSFTISELVSGGFPVHPDTVHAYNDIKMKD